MGEVNRYHVMRTVSAIYSAMKMLGVNTDNKALSIAEEKLKNL
jgi:aspartate aminotransferase-like enzyme